MTMTGCTLSSQGSDKNDWTGKGPCERPGKSNRRAGLEVGILELLSCPGINSKELIPPAYVAWQAGAATLFLLGS